MLEGAVPEVLTVKEISKSFGDTGVLSDLSLKMHAGDWALLLGANGSGKSTLLRICAQLLRADSGRVLDAAGKALTFRDFGYTGHQTQLYHDLTLRENLRLFAALYGLKLDSSRYLSEWELSDWADRPLRVLSKGLQTRAATARAILHSPRFLFLDEPTSALDDHAAALLAARLKEYQAGEGKQGFLLMATHDLPRLAPLANRILVLDKGRVACDSAEFVAGGKNVVAAKAETIEFYRKVNR